MAFLDEISNQIEDIRKEAEQAGSDNADLLQKLEKLLLEVEKKEDEHRKEMTSLHFAQAQVSQQYCIIDALAGDFSAIYVVACDNGMIIPIKQPDYLDSLKWLVDEKWTYEEAIERYIADHVHPEDRIQLREALDFEHVKQLLNKSKVYYHHFRIIRDGDIHYYYLKCTRVESGDVIDAIMVGFVCEDESKEKEILRTMSETDIMTKLYNRGTGEKKTRELIAKGTNGLFCMLDVDKFKSINDTYGHAVGDEVIIKVAHELKSAFRAGDVVFRLGGDEFAVFAPGILSRRVGMMILKEFIRNIKALEIPSIGDRKIEVSIGALLTWGEEVDFESIYEQADEGVYISKKTVGNTITFRPDEKCILVK